MIPEQRQQELLRLLQDAGVLSTRSLTDTLNVSHMTIRRDIAALEAEGRVVAVQGGVRLAERTPREPPRERSTRSTLEMPSKQAIAAAAASHVDDGMVVFLDAGTTCEAVVPHLADRTGITVVTNDFHTVEALGPYRHIDAIHTGGVIDRDRSSSNGPLAAATVRSLAIDLYLMSTGTWDAEFGVTVPVADTALLKKAALEASARSLLLADSTKFGAFERYRVTPLATLDGVITDDGLSAEEQESVTSRGVQLYTVHPSSSS
ncbi:DeoR family transcriptional regulator [Raineyella fluvialis]|uniref:DeoR family transcriptional regulator n=2 Tax=Raineyella fluvialis TaxID=2662261 RepID=A0A5Q2FK45_9ACTN|nr:DeoR family transcriptional regulator [Raineyella fluvialis]